MKRLIVNADDFGLTVGVNAGIIEAHQRGIVTSTTLMANMHGFEDAISKLKGNPHLGVGIHLNITWGKPVSPLGEVASLIGDDGRFRVGFRGLFTGLMTGKIKAEEVAVEFEAQISKIKEHVSDISHVDSHQHIHLFPRLGEMVLELVKKHRFRRLRIPQGRLMIGKFIFNKMERKQFIIYCLGNRLRNNDITICDNFYDWTSLGGGSIEVLKRIISRIGCGVTEISCHPGYVDADILKTESKLLESREKELAALTATSLKTQISERDIVLINYRTL